MIDLTCHSMDGMMNQQDFSSLAMGNIARFSYQAAAVFLRCYCFVVLLLPGLSPLLLLMLLKMGQMPVPCAYCTCTNCEEMASS